ncbi:uncharacterized protein METZ01_LOCUS208362, partial [marine metagenome]
MMIQRLTLTRKPTGNLQTRGKIIFLTLSTPSNRMIGKISPHWTNGLIIT